MKNILFLLFLFIGGTSNAEVHNAISGLVHESAEDGLKIAFESSVQLVSIKQEGFGIGSGNLFVYKGEQYIITANHVVSGSLFLDILEKNGNVASGLVILSNPALDLAIIKPISKMTGTFATEFKLSDNNLLGKEVYHCGHPIGTNFNLSKGMITAYDSRGYIIDSFSMPGSSGSVVFDKEGKVLGVVVSIAVFGEDSRMQLVGNITRVVPINLPEIIDSL